MTAAAPPPLVVRADRSVDGLEIGRARGADLVARFGAPTGRLARPPQSCTLAWRGVRLQVELLSLGEGEPCSRGVVVVATATRARTDRGLRVGDPVARLRRLYPRARLRAGGFWLVTRHACREVGGFAFAGLLARVRAGRVGALVAQTQACE